MWKGKFCRQCRTTLIKLITKKVWTSVKSHIIWRLCAWGSLGAICAVGKKLGQLLWSKLGSQDVIVIDYLMIWVAGGQSDVGPYSRSINLVFFFFFSKSFAQILHIDSCCVRDCLRKPYNLDTSLQWEPDVYSLYREGVSIFVLQGTP